MMADLLVVARAAGLAKARPRSMSASVRPAPNAPICRKLRRVRPSQNFCLAPQIVNIDNPPYSGKVGDTPWIVINPKKAGKRKLQKLLSDGGTSMRGRLGVLHPLQFKVHVEKCN